MVSNNENKCTDQNIADPDASAKTDNLSSDENLDNSKPLPRIHPKLHPHGYRMFSNHSSSNDIPGTSTGI